MDLGRVVRQSMLEPGIIGSASRTAWRVRKRLRKPQNAVVDRMSELMVENPVLTLADYDGEFEVLATSDVFRRIALKGAYESELADQLRRWLNPACDAMDIGANVGFYTVMMAKQLPDRRVLAAEPGGVVHAVLRRNVDRNGVAGRVTCWRGAVADTAGEAALVSVAGKPEYGALGRVTHPSVNGMETLDEHVTTSTVDALVEHHELDPSVIKVDVEGSEYKVLVGASETLERFRPVVVLELYAPMLEEQGASVADVRTLFDDHGYEVFGLATDLEPFDSAIHVDALAIPRSAI